MSLKTTNQVKQCFLFSAALHSCPHLLVNNIFTFKLQLTYNSRLVSGARRSDQTCMHLTKWPSEEPPLLSRTWAPPAQPSCTRAPLPHHGAQGSCTWPLCPLLSLSSFPAGADSQCFGGKHCPISLVMNPSSDLLLFSAPHSHIQLPANADAPKGSPN